MADDGIKAVAYHVFRNKLEALGLFEDPDHECPYGCKMWRRAVMGLGSPYIPVAYDGDDEMIHPPTIRKVIETFSVNASEWLAAPSDPPDDD